MPPFKIHYAGAISTPKLKILPGGSACCSGKRVEKILADGNNTYEQAEVTCEACKSVLAHHHAASLDESRCVEGHRVPTHVDYDLAIAMVEKVERKPDSKFSPVTRSLADFARTIDIYHRAREANQRRTLLAIASLFNGWANDKDSADSAETLLLIGDALGTWKEGDTSCT